MEIKKKKKKGPINEQTSPSRFRSTDIKEDVGVGREGGDKERTTTTDSLLLLTPTHLLSHWPTQLSPHPGVRRGSANSFLVLFHWSILTHSGERIKRRVPRRIRTPPFTAFKGSDEGMEIWKCSSQGSVKEAISIMPMSISYVEENNTSLWCLLHTEQQRLYFCWSLQRG